MRHSRKLSAGGQLDLIFSLTPTLGIALLALLPKVQPHWRRFFDI
jgi:hypothetical protein